MRKDSRGYAALSGISTLMLRAAFAALVAVTLLVLAQIVCRNVFDLGLPWADELARYCGVALVFLAMPRLLLDDKHIAMDIVPAMLPRMGQLVLGVAGKLLMIAFSGIILWALYKFLLRAAKFSTPALGIPNLVYYLPAILGFAFFGLIALYLIFRPRRTGPHLPEPDA